jgi:hypothetical protein
MRVRWAETRLSWSCMESTMQVADGVATAA